MWNQQKVRKAVEDQPGDGRGEQSLVHLNNRSAKDGSPEAIVVTLVVEKAPRERRPGPASVVDLYYATSRNGARKSGCPG